MQAVARLLTLTGPCVNYCQNFNQPALAIAFLETAAVRRRELRRQVPKKFYPELGWSPLESEHILACLSEAVVRVLASHGPTLFTPAWCSADGRRARRFSEAFVSKQAIH
jgi:hypothetical protein